MQNAFNIRNIAIYLLFLCSTAAFGQNHQAIDENIKTLKVVAGELWRELPIIHLNKSGANDVLNISFDDMQHEYRRFIYKVEHCEYDWQTSDALFESDYLDGFYDGLTIDDYTESINTQRLYTHYSFQFPNDKCRLKMSGNYLLTIIDEDDDKEVAKVCFMVTEDLTSVALSVDVNTDIDNRKSHQQVGMDVRYNGISPTRPDGQIHTVVLQNKQWSTAKWDAKWQYTNQQGLQWSHCRDLIFDAANEYHKYEILAVNHTTMGIDKIHWDESDYHVYPWPVIPSRSYVYDEDANASYLIRNSDNYESDFTTEYVFVHYRFLSDTKLPGDIFIDGDFTNGQCSSDYNIMEYNADEQCYEAAILQKQGYYNYTIMQQLPNGDIRHLPEDGNFHETNNSYQALIYYKSPTDRADRLVGYGKYGH